MYKILETAILQDGTKIQLEDWHPCNTKEFPNLYGYMIGAYPIAKNDSKSGFIRRNETFRFHIATNEYAGITDEIILEDWKKLKEGNAKLEDFAEHVTEQKYLYYLGVLDEMPWDA